MLARLLVLCSLLLLIMPAAEAKLFDNPETVSYLHADVIKRGSVILESTGPGARATTLEVRHSAPQETYRQSSMIKSMTGPDDYAIEKDDFGNDIIVLTWDDPPLDELMEYEVVFDVEVWDRDDPSSGTGFPTTSMTEPNQAITEKAYDLAGGLVTSQKFMTLASYVYETVEYDRTFQNTQKSASWVFENRKAVCDGHANLLISMLRSLGYDAYYVIGYAYTEDNPDPESQGYWGPHGWVEVGHNGKAFSLDPTWNQHPVDATHIKFAIAPDSNYTEYVQILATSVNVDWDKGDYVVELVESEESPRISIDSTLLPDSVGSGEHSLLMTGLGSSMDEPCILTTMKLQSCMEEGEPFLSMEPDEVSIGFCDNATLYWLLGAPELRPGIEYECGVTAYGAGSREGVTLRASAMPDDVRARMSTAKVVTPSQFFTIETTLENHGLSGRDLDLFMMLDGAAQTSQLSLHGMQSADVVWTMRAPRTPGTYDLRFFSSSGDLVEEELLVVESRSVEIAKLSVPGNVSVGDDAQFNVTLRGLGHSSGMIRITIGDSEYEKDFVLDAGDERLFTFTYSPGSDGVKQVSVVVLSGDEDYEDGLTSTITVARKSEWWEPIWDAVRDLLDGLFAILGMS